MAKVKSIEIEISSGYTVSLTPEEALSLRNSLNEMYDAEANMPDFSYEGPVVDWGSYLHPDCSETPTNPEVQFTATVTPISNGDFMVISTGEDFEVKKG